MTITKEILIKIIGTRYVTDKLVKDLNDTIEKFNINTKLRLSHFLAQILHESAGLRYTKENLNYSSEGLLKIFKKYFNTETAKLYARKPEKIANKVYANRMGNGNEESGEGWKYRGRGYVQLTGKNNYIAISNDLKIDYVKNPDLILETPMLVSGWFWNKNNLNFLADKNDVVSITKRINGGTNGLADREEWLKKCKLFL